MLAALKAATGKDHSGFFEFWASWGVEHLQAIRERQRQKPSG